MAAMAAARGDKSKLSILDKEFLESELTVQVCAAEEKND